MAKKNEIDIENEVIKIIRDEWQAWENQVVFVTDKVAFDIRNLLRQFRRNYWGIFNNPLDANTKKKKVWIPLTETTVDNYVKSIDIDQKNVTFIGKTFQAIGLANLVKSIVRNWLDEYNFGEELDETLRQLCIDGSHVWKSWEEDGELKTVSVDLLNLFFDMTGSESLQEKYRVTERVLMTPDDVKGMSGWINTEDVIAKDNLHPIDPRLSPATGVIKTSTAFVDVWETWGKIPKSLITGKDKDKDELIEGHLVISGLEGNPIVHLVEENVKKNAEGKTMRPYEEVHTKRIKGRWLARGPAESVMMLQSWMNTIVNIRITRAMVSQLGIFKIKRNAGVTPQMMSRLAANGAIAVNNMDDIEQLVMTEASQASYTDESNIHDWSQRVTSTFETITGEGLPASTPATNAILQTRQAAGSFKMVRDNVGSFIERWLVNHAIPILAKNLKVGDTIRLSGDPDELKSMDEAVVNSLLGNALDKIKNDGLTVSPEIVERERDKALAKFKGMGNVRLATLREKIDFDEFDVAVNVTNEKLDEGVMAQNLLQALQFAPQEMQGIIVKKLFQIMGIDMEELEFAVAQQQKLLQAAQALEIQQGVPLELPQGIQPQGATKPPRAGGGIEQTVSAVTAANLPV